MSAITPRLLSYPQAAAYLGRPEKTLRQMVHRGEIAYVKSNPHRRGTVLFDRLDLDAWIDEHKVPARSAS